MDDVENQYCDLIGLNVIEKAKELKLKLNLLVMD